MATIDRNAIIDALTARLKAGLGTNVKNVTRRLTDPAPEAMPYLVVGATSQQTNETDHTGPARWVVNVDNYLFVRDTGSIGPERRAQGLLDLIEEALKAQPGEEANSYWTTLGGRAWFARFGSVDLLVAEDDADTLLARFTVEILAKPVR